MSPNEATRSPTRVELPGAVDDKLFFAQVREDPLLELQALEPCLDGRIVIVSSGGCTALSLVAGGARDVVGVDLNRTQNHLVELKAAALTALDMKQTWAFLGAVEGDKDERVHLYDQHLRARLSPAAAAYWDDHRQALGNGVLHAGMTEKIIGLVSRLIRTVVHPRNRIDALLACETIGEQRALYHGAWNTRRWRAVFKLLFNRVVFRKVYDPVFFQHVDNDSFSAHFLAMLEHGITNLPVRTNYPLYDLLRGGYPVGVEGGVPPYLDPAHAEALGVVTDTLTLVDGTFGDYLKTQPDGSISGYALSNICEWLTPEQISELLAEIVRTAQPGARLCIRNFLGWTDIPDRWHDEVVVDQALSDALITQDRALCQARFLVCDIRRSEVPA